MLLTFVPRVLIVIALLLFVIGVICFFKPTWFGGMAPSWLSASKTSTPPKNAPAPVAANQQDAPVPVIGGCAGAVADAAPY
jgi:hypothetical protein